MSISTDIKQLLVARIEQSTPVEILRIASSIAANETIEAISAGHAARTTAPALVPFPAEQRFVNLGADGRPTTSDHVAVYDRKMGLTWLRGLVAGGPRNWKDSLAAASAVRLFNKEDWRAPTLEERLSINDYTKHSPALDTEHFAKESGWEWTSTPDAESPSDYAWNVNLGNGNSNRNNQSNHNFVRAVRAGEGQDAVTFKSLHSAWRQARRGKKPSADQLTFESNWICELLAIQRRLNAGTWHPSAPTCFIAHQPKAREIHAPTFADRVVHHLVVPPLEQIFERTFIHDSFSNRAGKGTHAAVARLRRFVREVHSGQGGGYYLQLDVRNFFASIHRPTLWSTLKPRMERAALPLPLKRAVHALLTWPISRTGVRWACTDAERAAVPAHKRLENALPNCGIAIGNLSSQFFANVYLDQLDQFVKHELRAQRYVRYVDDFVLVHHDWEQLAEWHAAIVDFLRYELKLSLKEGARLEPLTRGIDFLGYVVFPTHTVVRRRVVAHCHAKLAQCGRNRTPAEQVRSIWASYAGHFRHASSHRIVAAIHRRFRWLKPALSKPTR